MNRYEQDAWNHTPFVPPETALYGGMHRGFDVHFSRIAPFDGGVTLEWLPYKEAAKYNVTVVCQGETVGFGRNRPEGALAPRLLDAGQLSATFNGLSNNKDYETQIFALNERGEVIARSQSRRVRSGVFPGTMVNYIHPLDYTYAFSGRSPASPFLLKLPSGALLCSHDVFWNGEGQNLTILFRSDDGGASWQYVTELCPCFWGKMFYYKDTLYMMGVDGEYGAYLIGCSKDEGRTWSKPVKLIAGGNREEAGPHQAPTPVVFHQGRVWTAVERGSWDLHFHHSGILSGDLSKDLMDPASWAITPYTAPDPKWPGAVKGGCPALLEGNVFVLPNGRIGNLLRYHTKDATPDYGVAILLSLDPDAPEKAQRFERAVALDGNYTKFYVLRQEETKKYYMLLNRPDEDCHWRRDILSLAESDDGENWRITRDLIDERKAEHREGPNQAAFQYPSMVLDGGELLYVVRTAKNGAWNFHNANAITFDRIHL